MKVGIIAALIVAGAFSARGQIYQYTVRGVFDETSFGSSIAVGDQGRLTFTLDYSKTDTWPASDFGVFPDAVSAVNFSLESGAAGNYPSGSMNATWQAEVGNSAFGDQFRFILYAGVTPGLNFPNPTGSVFSKFDIILQGGPSLFSFYHSTGDSLASVIGTQPLNLADFPNQRRFTLWADGNSKYASAVITSINAVAVPEPSVGTFLLFGCALLPMLRRRHL